MIHKIASGNQQGAMNELSTSVIFSTLSLVLCALLVTAGISLFCGHIDRLNSIPNLGIIAALLSIQMLFNMLRGYLISTLKADSKYNISVWILTASEGAQSAFVFAALWLGFRPLALSCVYAVTAAVGCIAIYIAVRRSVSWFKICLKPDPSHFVNLKAMLSPSLGYFASSLGQLLSLQGVRLVIGQVLSPADVAVFAAHRQIARISLLLLTFLNPVMIESTRAHGNDDRERFEHLTFRGANVSFWTFTSANAVLFLISGPLFSIWLGSKLPYDASFMLVITLVTLIEGLWRIFGAPAQALNLHSGYSRVYLLSMSAMLPLGWFAGKIWGLPGVGLAMLFAELTVLFFSFRAGSSALEVPHRLFLIRSTAPPFWVFSTLRKMNTHSSHIGLSE